MSPGSTMTAVSPTASPVPPVVVVTIGPPPASIFSARAMPNVSTKSGSGLVGRAYAAQPRISSGFSSSSTSVRKTIRSSSFAIARTCSSAGPVPATTSFTSSRHRICPYAMIRS
jgi:hypothetical protein